MGVPGRLDDSKLKLTVMRMNPPKIKMYATSTTVSINSIAGSCTNRPSGPSVGAMTPTATSAASVLLTGFSEFQGWIVLSRVQSGLLA